MALVGFEEGTWGRNEEWLIIEWRNEVADPEVEAVEWAKSDRILAKWLLVPEILVFRRKLAEVAEATEDTLLLAATTERKLFSWAAENKRAWEVLVPDAPVIVHKQT